METLRSLFGALGVLLAFSPLFLAVLGAVIASERTTHRWVIHLAVVAGMLAGMPGYLALSALWNPSMVDHPGPGEGLGLLLWAVLLVPAFIVYFWLASRKVSNW